MRKVHATTDDSGHWYVIPSELIDEFTELELQIEEETDNQDLIKKFETKFGKYRTGEDLNLTQLYAVI